jgi:hypothetical protein
MTESEFTELSKNLENLAATLSQIAKRVVLHVSFRRQLTSGVWIQGQDL